MSQNQKPPPRRRSAIGFALFIAVLAILAILTWNTGGILSPGQSQRTAPSSQTNQPSTNSSSTVALTAQPPASDTETDQVAQPERASALPTVAYDDLPAQAHDTISLIDQGGPFPFSKDGSTFQNREALLPDKPPDYYREYTVITPGESDRGARRIVAGAAGELYYTDDHYASFDEVIR